MCLTSFPNYETVTSSSLCSLSMCTICNAPPLHIFAYFCSQNRSLTSVEPNFVSGRNDMPRETNNEQRPEAPPEAIAASLRLAVNANELVMASKKTNDGYIREYKRYQRWLKSQPNQELRRNPELCVQNIEFYFSTEVAFRKGKASTQNGWVAAIQHYVDISPKGPHLPEDFKLRNNRVVKKKK